MSEMPVAILLESTLYTQLRINGLSPDAAAGIAAGYAARASSLGMPSRMAEAELRVSYGPVANGAAREAVIEAVRESSESKPKRAPVVSAEEVSAYAQAKEKQPSLHDAIKDAVEVGAQVRAPEVLDLLVKNGYRFNPAAKTAPGQMVSLALSKMKNDGQFRSVERGLYERLS